MSASATEHVVVIGGGILGVSTAAHLARAGRRTTLLTAEKLANGASRRSIAWLNSSGDRSAAYHYLRLLGMDRYRTWSSRHPDSRSYLRFDGALKWAGADASLQETFEFERAGGYDAVWLDRADIAERVPEVNPDAVAEEGGIYNPGEGWVNLPDLIAALADEARAAGASIREDAGDVRIDVRDGCVVGALLSDGSSVAADRVVLATGSAVPGQLSELGVSVPDASPPAFVVFTDRVDFEQRTVLNTPSVAVRPTPDGRLVLDADWAEKSIRVGDDGVLTIPEESVQGLLDEASTVLAGAPKLTAARVGAGLKPIPGDGNPVTGPVPGVAGLHVLFTHSGATLGLILGELTAEEIVTDRLSPVLADFRVDRFGASRIPQAVGTDAWAPVLKR
jgi:glycine/D-amino acid oxidase-like deaminating enzyme